MFKTAMLAKKDSAQTVRASCRSTLCVPRELLCTQTVHTMDRRCLYYWIVRSFTGRCGWQTTLHAEQHSDTVCFYCVNLVRTLCENFSKFFTHCAHAVRVVGAVLTGGKHGDGAGIGWNAGSSTLGVIKTRFVGWKESSQLLARTQCTLHRHTYTDAHKAR